MEWLAEGTAPEAGRGDGASPVAGGRPRAGGGDAWHGRGRVWDTAPTAPGVPPS